MNTSLLEKANSILNQIPERYAPQITESGTMIYLTFPEFIAIPTESITIQTTEVVVRMVHNAFVITLWKNVTSTNVTMLTDLH
jgi:hypothetical protein